jgi:translation elongation factor EF-G
MNIYHPEDFKVNEHLKHQGHEKFEAPSKQELHQSQENLRKHHETAAEKSEVKSHEEIEQIRLHAEHEAKSATEIQREASHGSTTQENEPAFINYELKEIAYQRILKRARRHLPTYSRAMSRVIHQPLVDNVSEVVGKTVGRPSGIIGGGLMALVGTTIYYVLTRHFGYSYNPFVFLFLMIVGFIIGWSSEVIFKMLKNLSNK